MPHLPMFSQRELARLSNVSARTLGRLGLPRTRSGDYALAPTLEYLLRRLLLAESICRKWADGELEARLDDGDY
jgi:hypothetical protein